MIENYKFKYRSRGKYFFVPNEKDRRHLLKTIKIDGTEETELFSRPGDAMWAASPAGHGEIGEQLALSAIGGRVAFITALKPIQMPSAYLQSGLIEIWDLKKKAGGKTDISNTVSAGVSMTASDIETTIVTR